MILRANIDAKPSTKGLAAISADSLSVNDLVGSLKEISATLSSLRKAFFCSGDSTSSNSFLKPKSVSIIKSKDLKPSAQSAAVLVLSLFKNSSKTTACNPSSTLSTLTT